MKILIGTPTYNHQVTAPFMSSVLALAGALHMGGHQFEWIAAQGTLIHFARNLLATTTLADQTATHLLFVDADVSFRPQAVERMLNFDKPVVSTLYPHRSLDAAKVARAAQQGAGGGAAIAAGLSYPFAATTPPRREGGFATAEVAPTGLMLIKREVFELMADPAHGLYRNTANTQYATLGLSQVLLAFEPSPNSHGVMVGEDVAFCKRWRALGGEIWALLDEPTAHIGPFIYSGAMG